jgi:hypothetical protein
MGSCCAVVVEEGIEEVVAEKGVVHGRLSLVVYFFSFGSRFFFC